MKKYILRASAGLAAALLLTAGLYLATLETVTLRVDGETRSLRTRALTVRGALTEAGIRLGEGDTASQPLDRLTWDLPAEIEIVRASRVTVLDGSQRIDLLTSLDTPAALLALAGMQLAEGDRLLIDGAAVEADQTLAYHPWRTLQVVRAVEITLSEDGQTRTLRSSAATLGQALWDAGIRLDPADRLQPGAETPLTAPINVTLTRAKPVTIHLGAAQTLTVSTAAQTVGEALAGAGVPLQGMDICQPAENEPLDASRSIRVTQVREALSVTQEFQAYTTEYQFDDQTELDQESIVQPGSTGMTVTRERIRYENGVETGRGPAETWQALAPRTEIIGRGTKVVIHKEVVDGVEIEYWRKLTVYATSYSPCRVGGGRCDSGTASGMPVQRGTIAVTVDWFLAMQGQALYVPGYGKGYIGDTGGGIDGRYWIDLAYSDGDYVSWHQWVTIYFLTPVPVYVPPVLYP